MEPGSPMRISGARCALRPAPLISIVIFLATLLLALHIVAILATGGYRLTIIGVAGRAADLTPSLMTLLVLGSALVALERVRIGELRRAHQCVLIFSSIFLIYLANGRTLGSGDTMPARYLPLSILRNGDFILDEFAPRFTRAALHSLRIVEQGGNVRRAIGGPTTAPIPTGTHYVSAYPVGSALVALPFYLPTALAGVAADEVLIDQLEKLSASAIVAISAAVLFATAARLTSGGMALFIVAAYSLGTSSLSVSSQGLWQHGPSQLALTAALHALVRARDNERWAAWAGFPVAFAIVCRPTNMLIALPLGFYVLRHHRRQFREFLVASLLPMIFQLLYNTRYFGDPLHSQFPLLEAESWSTPTLKGLGGLLFSPARGLFVYSPILLLSVAGLVLVWRGGGDRLLRHASVGVLLVMLIHSKWRCWWGGVCYGPRLLADLTPILALALYPLDTWFRAHAKLRLLAVPLLCCSIYAHFIGAFWGDGVWNEYPLPETIWAWTENPVVDPARLLVERVIIWSKRIPTSRTAPQLLSARYSATLPPTTAASSEHITFHFDAVNSGTAVWISSPRREQRSVQLVWTLSAGDSKLCDRGRMRLRHDVFPGDSYRFPISLIAPQQPGDYILELGLIDGHRPSFEVRGVPPLRLTLRVGPRRHLT